MEERQSRLSSMVWRRLRPYFCVRLILLNSMFSNFCHVLKQKLKAVSNKKSDSIKAFFRYARVKKRFLPLISEALIDCRFIKSANEILEISQRGGNMNRVKFRRIVK